MSVSLPVICSTGRSLQGLVLPARASMNGTETACVASQIGMHTLNSNDHVRCSVDPPGVASLVCGRLTC